jgi:cephalosporin hydroxylase
MVKTKSKKLPPFRASADNRDFQKDLRTVIDFNVLYALSKTPIHWCGFPLQKNPCDLWIYQQLIFEQRPDIIIETGTSYGGSALFLSMICDIVGHGEVVTIDTRPENNKVSHPRLTALSGSSTNENVLDKVKKMVGSKNVLIILDSDHERKHVARELELYSQFVQIGGYIIVEDTNFDGPAYAVKDFLLKNSMFTMDREKEFLMLTFNPGGYLKRLS